MEFLGKITKLEYHGAIETLFIRSSDGAMVVDTYNPNYPNFVFLVYDAGDGWLMLLAAATGQWLTLETKQTPEGLCVVYGSTSDEGTRFSLAGFDPAGSIALNWVDNGKQVGLVQQQNTYTWFVCTPGWSGQRVSCQVLAPGVPTIRRMGSCQHADFRSVGKAVVDLSGADLANVDATGARFDGAVLTGTILTGTTLTGASFRGTALHQTDFRDADDTHPTVLAGADFSGCTLTPDSVYFPGPPISKDTNNPTKLCNATVDYGVIQLDWSNLDLTGATITDIPQDSRGRLALNNLRAAHTVMAEMQLENARLRHAVFDNATLAGANLTGADLSYASFDTAWLAATSSVPNAANLSGALLFDAKFHGALLTGVQFIGAYLYGADATVAGATMPLVKFTDAYLANMDFSNVRDLNMQDADFTGACLVNCNFQGSSVQPFQGANASFDHACLQGADFTDCQLSGANLLDAAVAQSPGTLPVTLIIDGQPMPISVNYQPTMLPPSATTKGTTCPSSANGPCIGDKLASRNAPTRWPAPAKGDAGRPAKRPNASRRGQGAPGGKARPDAP